MNMLGLKHSILVIQSYYGRRPLVGSERASAKLPGIRPLPSLELTPPPPIRLQAGRSFVRLEARAKIPVATV